jgi:hypothetical protein
LGWGFVKIIAINQFIHDESPQETEKGRKEKTNAECRKTKY